METRHEIIDYLHQQEPAAIIGLTLFKRRCMKNIKLVDLVAPYAIPSEILPYLSCRDCEADFWIRPCADLDWSKHGFEYPD